ncbi:MAG: PilZ domain-containing protein [Planctomycetota bacterium]|jgi:hypothetical protein
MCFRFYYLVLNFLLALTPAERWQAARRFGSSFMGDRWFILTAVASMLALTVLFLIVSLRRLVLERSLTERLFLECAQRRGLSAHERQILLDVAARAGLKKSDAIFTMEEAFDRGSAKVVQESLIQPKADEQSRQLRNELLFLREKLGFHKGRSSSIGSPAKSRKLSSRQIPAGRTVYMTRRRRGRDSSDVETTIAANNDMELIVRPITPVRASTGELWRVRYHFGASIWEFDTAVIGSDGDVLVLHHSDTVRFISRRRFLRVPVNKPALIAPFPFARTLSHGRDRDKGTSATKGGSAVSSTGSWGPPEFVPAVVTELGGPGLRIEAPLQEIQIGGRVLVVLNLDEDKDGESMSPRPNRKTAASRIVEDIGEVRHAKATRNGLSVAVELTGLSDSDVNDLIRATNLASVRAGAENRRTGHSVNAEKYVVEPASV